MTTNPSTNFLARTCAGCAVSIMLAIPALAEPANDHPWDGTSRNILRDRVAFHAYNSSGADYKPRPVSAVDRNEIAVVEDNGAILSPAKSVDLANRTLIFRPTSGGGFSLESRSDGLSGAPGTPITLGDDDTSRQNLPFSFPIGGQSFNQVFVNSDGNLSFTAGDTAAVERSVGQMVALPRLCGLFEDLNPSVGGQVLVDSGSGAFVVTWNQVPKFGTTIPSTFQIRMQPDGTVTYIYGSIGTTSAVVGVSPRAGSNPKAVDMSAGNATSAPGEALVEAFRPIAEIDDVAVTQAFYSNHADRYDFVVMFNDLAVAPLAGAAFAYHAGVRNSVDGIGLVRFDAGSFYGSASRLQSFLNMGPITQYPSDPNTSFLGTNSSFDIMGQEAGHKWGAFATFLDRGQESTLLLGRANSHWSFCMDSDASDMEGNDIQDNGDGSFTTVAATSRFSLLDQYLMGLVPASMVPPTFYVEPCDVRGGRGAAPDVGVTFRGTRHNVVIDDIVRSLGNRNPAVGRAPTTFTMAFLLIVGRGATPPNRTLRAIDTIRRYWPPYFRAATDNRGTMITTLDGGPEDTEEFPSDDGGGGNGNGGDDGGGCGSVTTLGGPGRGPGSGLGTASLILAVGLLLAADRRRRLEATR